MKTYSGNVFEGHKPNIAENVFIADGAKVIGDVTIGEYSGIWYNCVLRGDVNKIIIGKYTNVQDGSIIHESDTHPCEIGDYVTIGHGAIIHACKIEDHVLIGMGAIVLDGSIIGRGSIVGAGSVVTTGSIIPPFSLVIGTPGKVVKTLSDRMDNIHAQALKYKTLWAERYALLPDNDGEKYRGEKIVLSSKDK